MQSLVAPPRPAHREDRRGLNNLFLFWRLCGEAPCRRARACVGEMHACFTRHWAMMPERDKVRVRAVITARAQGRSANEALAAAAAEVERWERDMARDMAWDMARDLAREGAPPAGAAASPASPAADRVPPPRLRTV